MDFYVFKVLFFLAFQVFVELLYYWILFETLGFVCCSFSKLINFYLLLFFGDRTSEITGCPVARRGKEKRGLSARLLG